MGPWPAIVSRGLLVHELLNFTFTATTAATAAAAAKSLTDPNSVFLQPERAWAWKPATPAALPTTRWFSAAGPATFLEAFTRL